MKVKERPFAEGSRNYPCVRDFYFKSNRSVENIYFKREREERVITKRGPAAVTLTRLCSTLKLDGGERENGGGGGNNEERQGTPGLKEVHERTNGSNWIFKKCATLLSK
jgi:hypothetical protein